MNNRKWAIIQMVSLALLIGGGSIFMIYAERNPGQAADLLHGNFLLAFLLILLIQAGIFILIFAEVRKRMGEASKQAFVAGFFVVGLVLFITFLRVN
ncbi:hypothetical protein [Evansella clarkii]|uniref:hypothetical protein n=1 Tax=Evansella clarkii TaxID=79879 RepID=UPI00099744BB|nr:hypothetical protein [Evansella clarkii]